jgi:hypothetical protein
MNMNQSSQSHLFTMRLWIEDMGNGQWEWRGKLRYVVTEEVRYFRDWQGLVALMQTMTQPTSAPSLVSSNGNGSDH